MKEITQNHFTSTKKWPKQLYPQAFHGLAGEFVSTIEPHSEADEAALLVQFLAAYGSIIGRSAHFPVEADKHFSNMFVIAVGESAKGRKGTSWGHIRNVFREVDPYWESNCIKSGLSSGEGLIWKVRNGDENPIGRTPDCGVSDKRLCIVETEFASVLKSLERDGNKLSSVIRDCWDKGTLETLTKSCSLRATNAHVSIIGHITKPELRKYLSDTEIFNGFGNRFLWICVKRSKILPLGGKVPTHNLIHKLKDAVTFGKQAGALSFDDQAKEGWIELYMKLSTEKPGLLGVVTARAEPQILRLATIYALLDCSAVVTYPHLVAAQALWQYSQDSCQYIFGNSTGDKVADRIHEELRFNPTGLTQTEISYQIFNRHKSAKDIHEALEILQSFSLIYKIEEIGSEGRPRIRWLSSDHTPATRDISDVSIEISPNSRFASM